jgi:hypothetical protein
VIRAVAVTVCTLALVALLPEAAHACPVCFDANDENRRAFLVTTAFLSLLPLGMVMGLGLWIRKRSREIDGDEVRHDPDPNRPEP